VARKKNKNGYGLGTFVETEMFLSKAFMSLGKRGTSKTVSCASAQMLILLLGKRGFRDKKDKKGNKGKPVRVDDNKFKLPYKELSSRGIKTGTAARGFDELLAKGFIEIINPGGAYAQDQAIYGLVDDWRFWKLGDAPVRKRTKDINRGWQGKGIKFKKKDAASNGTIHTAWNGTIPDSTHSVERNHIKKVENETRA
jgi:hypothetical protein